MTATLEANISKAAVTGAELTQCQKALGEQKAASTAQLQDAGLRIRQLEQQLADETARNSASMATSLQQADALRYVSLVVVVEPSNWLYYYSV